ncbi:MAG: YeeE/YedE family protein [Acidimicrobiales bacterium]|nr:YeeE/YedE family protein [Hyphomonadaceae bacterium]RZV43267.1 MAG: YeeE/YedE family protein [Acidimicrobiales bacterium]
MTEFTPISALIGGGLIGLAAVLLMLLNGRIAGISGILGGLLRFDKGEFGWRAAFIAGLIVGPVVYMRMTGTQISITTPEPGWAVILAGLIVGVGTQIGNGCTSGHGVCGIARLSGRSIAATVTFLLTGVLTVTFVRHGLGGLA